MPRRHSKHEPTASQIVIYRLLVDFLQPFVQGLRVKRKSAYQYELWTDPKVRIYTSGKNRRRQNGVLFAVVSVQKEYVGLYFFPLQVDSSFKVRISPKLLPFLKESSTFHFNELEPEVAFAARILFEDGWNVYRSLGWVR